MTRQLKKKIDQTTEEKIKIAARKLFTRKGFAAVKTRDIAEEAGINLALLNYYFRSKEKLFKLIMEESFLQFIKGIAEQFNDESTSIDEKIEKLVNSYIDLFAQYPDLPLFIMSELREHPDAFSSRLDAVTGISKSVFVKQIREAIKNGVYPEMHVFHFLANMMSLIVFPFIGSPMLMKITSISPKQYSELLLERKKMIPVWIKAMLKTKNPGF